MKLKEINNKFYLLSDKPFNQKIESGTEYYDGKGNIRIWGTGNCFSTDSVNIIASTEPIGKRPLISTDDIYNVLENRKNIDRLAEEWFEHDILKADRFYTNSDDLKKGFRTGFIKKQNLDLYKIFTLDELKKAMRIMIGVGMEIGREPSYDANRINETVDSVVKTAFPEKTEWDVDVTTEANVLFEDGDDLSEMFVPKIINGYVTILNK